MESPKLCFRSVQIKLIATCVVAICLFYEVGAREKSRHVLRNAEVASLENRRGDQWGELLRRGVGGSLDEGLALRSKRQGEGDEDFDDGAAAEEGGAGGKGGKGEGGKGEGGVGDTTDGGKNISYLL